jgi:hypothetical protein
MTVYELSRDQLIELKQAYITEKNDEVGEGTSWGELADADELVDDKEIFAAYECYDFVNDDFFCTAGRE